MKLIIVLVVCIGLVATPNLLTADEQRQKTLTFGVVPQQSASKLAQLWAPILAHLSKQTGYAIEFQTAPSIPLFEQRLSSGEYDLAYMNPYHYTVFNRSPGYVAFAKAKNKKIKGIIVVRKDSRISSLKELNNQNLAFPAPAAFAATLLPVAHFKTSGITVIPNYVASHDSVYRAVAKGLFPAGGGVIRTFENVDPGVREQLRILWTSEGYTPHALAAHPSLPIETVNEVRKALLHMADDQAGNELLKKINIAGFEVATNKDWDDVRKLNIEMLNELVVGK